MEPIHQLLVTTHIASSGLQLVHFQFETAFVSWCMDIRSPSTIAGYDFRRPEDVVRRFQFHILNEVTGTYIERFREKLRQKDIHYYAPSEAVPVPKPARRPLQEVLAAPLVAASPKQAVVPKQAGAASGAPKGTSEVCFRHLFSSLNLDTSKGNKLGPCNMRSCPYLHIPVADIPSKRAIISASPASKAEWMKAAVLATDLTPKA